MIWDDFTNVYNLFEDEISKKIYEAKVNWYFKGGIDETNNILYEYYNDSRIVGLENYNCKNVAICGAGNYGLQSYKALVHAGYKVCAFWIMMLTRWGPHWRMSRLCRFHSLSQNLMLKIL